MFSVGNEAAEYLVLGEMARKGSLPSVLREIQYSFYLEMKHSNLW